MYKLFNFYILLKQRYKNSSYNYKYFNFILKNNNII